MAGGDQIRVLPAAPGAASIILGGVQSLRRDGRRALRPPQDSLVLERVPLDARAIAAYASLCGFSERQGVPLTYPHMLGFGLHMAAMLQPSFPYPLIGLVHLSNSIRQHRTLRAGETLRIAVRFGAVLRHDRGQAFELLTTAECPAECPAECHGVAVWESRSTYLRLGVEQPDGEAMPPPPPGPQPLTVEGRWRMPRAIGRRYAVLSGDRNPIHTSSIGARMLGFRRPIAHGMWMLARSAAALLPDAPVAAAELDAVFRAPALLPGTALLLSTRRAAEAGAEAGARTLFELRDGRAEQLHLRGTLRSAAGTDRT